MRAMVLDNQQPVEQSPLAMREVADPAPRDNEVRIKVSVCAVCRTDIHIVEGDLPLVKRPIIPGHQVVGRVDQIGASCKRFKMGQRVGAAWLRWTDGTCRFCRRDRENLCESAKFTGYDADGGYAECATVPEEFAYELPEGMDDAHVSPLLCGGLIGYRSLNRAQLPKGGRLLMVGFGSSAHVILPISLHRGHEVFVITRSENHIRSAKEAGATWAGDDFSRLSAKMDGAILFAPTGKLVPPTMEALDRGGRLSIAGIHLSEIPPLNYQKHLYQEREIVSVTANTRQDGRDLLREAVDANVTPKVHEYALSDANRALIDMKNSRIDGTAVLVI